MDAVLVPPSWTLSLLSRPRTLHCLILIIFSHHVHHLLSILWFFKFILRFLVHLMFKYNQVRCVTGTKAVWLLSQGASSELAFCHYHSMAWGALDPHRWSQNPNPKWGRRERGREESLKGSQHTWEQRSKDKIINKGGMWGGEMSTFPILPVLTQPLRH